MISINESAGFFSFNPESAQYCTNALRRSASPTTVSMLDNLSHFIIARLSRFPDMRRSAWVLSRTRTCRKINEDGVTLYVKYLTFLQGMTITLKYYINFLVSLDAPAV